MTKQLIKKLGGFTELSELDRITLAQAGARRVRNVAARANIILEGERPHRFYLILQGWACGYKALANGRRQIIGFFLPGDVCHLNLFLLGQMDHSIGAITQVTISEFNQSSLEVLEARAPRVIHALWWESLVTSAIQREWMVNIAQRAALERLAHLICELFERLQNVGLTSGSMFESPLTQADVADALGLTGIHVNRMFQRLRSLNLLVLKDRRLRILDVKALQQLAAFDPNYLHLSQDAVRRQHGQEGKVREGGKNASWRSPLS